MTPLEALFSADFAAAMTVLLVFSLLEPPLTYHANRWLDGNHVFHWTWAYLVQPLLRALAIAAFTLLAYPAIYGARAAPALEHLLGTDETRTTVLVNVLFVASLLLPLLPALRERTTAAVPLQGLLATAMVFSWYAEYLGVTTATLWPGTAAALAVIVMATIAHWLAVESGLALGYWLDERTHRTGFDRLVPNALVLLAQAPVMLYYGLTLGRQIAI